MGFIDTLFNGKKDPLAEAADNLVAAANAFAVSLFIPTVDQNPSLSKVDPGSWDFIVTVAGVFIASNRLNNLHVDRTREERLMKIVAGKLCSWNPGGIRAFDDCKGLFEKEYDRLMSLPEYNDHHFLAVDALGVWVVWNILERQPQSDEEIRLVRMVGGAVVHAFFDWWQQS